MEQEHGWTQEKTLKLVTLVETYNETKQPIQWDEVALQFPGLSKIQCKAKYIKTLSSELSDSEKYHEWTALEKELLMDCVDIFGRDWDKIQRKCFTWMTPLKLKNKHYALTKTQNERDEREMMLHRVEMKKKRIAHLDEENVYRVIRQILNIK